MILERLNAPPRTAAGGAGCVLLGAFFVQWAATLAVPAFSQLGPSATSGWRFFVGAVVLLALVRPKISQWSRRQWVIASAFGIATALMNLSFYQAIARTHLGTAVAIEYLGPFLVAALGKRSWRHFGFVVMAAGGVVAIARPGSGLTVLAALFAGLAGVGWAAYTVASHRVGGATNGFEGLAVAMTIAAVITLPFTASTASTVFSSGSLLLRMSAMALLATVLGFGAEMQALRRLPPTTVSVLLALDPAVAFIVGLAFLGQSIRPLDLLGMALVVLAGIGVTRDAPEAVAVTIP